jgi:acyl-CoA reductase-like NAD-dependent aldehyde dehydrogenase
MWNYLCASKELIVHTFNNDVLPHVETVETLWVSLPASQRLSVAALVFAISTYDMKTKFSYGPVTFVFLVTKAIQIAALLLLWHAVGDHNQLDQLCQMVSAVLLIKAAWERKFFFPVLGSCAAYSFPEYVPPAVAGTCGAILVSNWLLNPSIPKVEVDMTPQLPEEVTVVSAGFRIDSVPGKIQCVNPCTNELLGELEAMDADAVDACVRAATEAQKEWVKTSFDERRRVLRTMQRWILDHQSEIQTLCCLDSGKSKVGAAVGEIVPTCEKIAWVLREGERALQPSPRANGPGLATMMKCGWVEYVPFGVLGIIAPWNYPFHNFMNHVVSGLFSGNALVCKPSEFTSWSGAYFLKFVRGCLEACGHSPDLVQVVTGHAATGKALVAHQGIKKIIFTGSGAVGKHVMRGAADNLTPVVMELGGKDPAIVCEDADLGQVMPLLLRGAFQNAGQNCMGLERVYAHTQIQSKLVAKAKEGISKICQCDPLAPSGCDVGGMVTPAQLAHVAELVDDAVANGAKVIIGGKVNTNGNGHFYEPTLLVDVTNDMRIVQEEVFGPVMLVITFSSDEEVIAMADDTDYGLAMSVFAADRTRAENIARRIGSGVSNINDFGCNYLMQGLPFGGIKGSGFGRFAGIEGMRACCYTKAMTGDLFSFTRTQVPNVLQYPVNETSNRFSQALAVLSYDDSWLGRLSGLCSIITNLVK